MSTSQVRYVITKPVKHQKTISRPTEPPSNATRTLADTNTPNITISAKTTESLKNPFKLFEGSRKRHICHNTSSVMMYFNRLVLVIIPFRNELDCDLNSRMLECNVWSIEGQTARLIWHRLCQDREFACFLFPTATLQPAAVLSSM